MSAGGREWPAGTVFLDGAAARAAAAKAVPGQSWTAVPSAPAAAEPLRAPRVGLYKPWAASMDEGWTRFVLEQYGFEPKTLDNKAVRAGGLNAAFDAIVLPDVTKEMIATGKPKRDEGAMRYSPELPAEYTGGLEKEGAAALKDFVEKGGTLVALSSSTEYVIDELALPVRNGAARAEGFAIAGSILRAEVASGHPVTDGLPGEVAVFQDEALAFDTVLPGPEMDRRVLASYPAAPVGRPPLGLDARPGGDRPQGGGGGADLRQGEGGAPRLPRAAPRADAGHVPVPLQRALLVHGEVAAAGLQDGRLAARLDSRSDPIGFGGSRPTPSASATRLM